MWDSSRQSGPGAPRAAFTVAELMLAVAILGVIVFALYSVFNQTQKALRSTETQGNVAEKARAILEIIAREIEQAQATHSAIRIQGTTNLVAEWNFAGGYERGPTVQRSDRTDIQPRTNFFHNLFFYNNKTNAWQGIGYRVVDVTNGVGVLQRFQTNQFGFRPLENRLANAFFNEPVTNASFHHVADGVIHLAFIPYDRYGYRIGFDTTNRTPDLYRTFRTDVSGSRMFLSNDVPVLELANVYLAEGYSRPRAESLAYATRFRFMSNALPAFIDLEFGILEPETLAQYYTMVEDKNPNATNFLARQVSKVHLFKQRIPIRTAAQ